MDDKTPRQDQSDETTAKTVEFDLGQRPFGGSKVRTRLKAGPALSKKMHDISM